MSRPGILGHLFWGDDRLGEEFVWLQHVCRSFVGERSRWPDSRVRRFRGWPRTWGFSESGLRRWIAQADIDNGRAEGLTSDERAKLVQLRRDKRVLEMETEIFKRASAHFARETVLPTWGSGSSESAPPTGCPWR